ncbi:MAG: hypothetical protein HKP30_18005 [Myxococcales bacterium]|nr:hypothetical protein [Myxococcales bacterium]
MRKILFVASAAALLWAAPASAMTFGFGCLTNNLAGDCAIGEAQLSVDVLDIGGGSVRFLFSNAGPDASAIAEVYFDDGSLLALSTVIDGPGVDFEPDASPPNLPGGQNAVPPFQVTAGFLAEASSPPPQNGVGPGEWLAIDFTLQGAQTHADVLSELDDGTLRIGIHVIGFGSGGSESFIHTPVPEPGHAALVGCVALAFAAARRRSA